MHALNGRNGYPIWKRPRLPDGLSQESLRNWTSPTLCDLNNDGTLEVVCIEPSPTVQANGVNQQHIQITMLDSTDGHIHWTFDTDTVFTHFHSFGDKILERMRPVSLRVGNDKSCFGVFLPGGDPRFVIGDYDGKVTQMKQNHRLRDARVLARHGAEGTSDLILVHDESGLSMVTADQLEKPLWQRSFPNAAQIHILNSRLGDSRNLTEIVAAMPSTDNTVLGIDTMSGATRWSCPGPIVRDRDDGVYITPSRIDYLGDIRQKSPLVSYTTAQAVECRQAVKMLSAEERLNKSGYMFADIERLPAQLPHTIADTRWHRALPWVADLKDIRQQVIPFVLWGTFLSLSMIILPLGYLRFLFSKGQFGLKTLLGLPIVAGVVLLSSMITSSVAYDFRSPQNQLFVGLTFAPPLLGIGILITLGVRGQKRSLAFWGFLTIAASLVWGALHLSTMFAQSPLLPQESIDWSGWHLIFLFGFYLTSWLMLLFYLALWLWSKLAQARTRTPLAPSP